MRGSFIFLKGGYRFLQRKSGVTSADSITTNTYSVRNVAVTSTKKSHVSEAIGICEGLHLTYGRANVLLLD